MSSFRYREQKKRSQPGFTLIEMVVALAVAAVVLVSTIALGRYIAVATGDQSDQVLANLQVQYVSFWISEDVVQAGNVSLSDSTVGDLFVLYGEDQWDQQYTVTYRIDVNMKDELGRDLASLSRTKVGGQNAGTSTVAEYLDPSSTKCDYQRQQGNATVLILDVTAMVDQKVARGIYEINPRAGNITRVRGW